MRLERATPGHVAWYSVFEQRLRDFVSRYAIRNKRVPVEAILNEMLKRWIDQPACCGYYLACSDEKVTGHLASWITPYYSQSKCFLWQAEMDEPSELLVPMINILKGWVGALNANLPEEARVTELEWTTWHPAPAFARYLKKADLNVIQTMSILTAEI